METGATSRHPAGMGKPTINDVAREAGVSKKTVSRVINRSPLLGQQTRERVEAVIARLGYVPNPQARALALRRNFTIALVHDGTCDALLPLAIRGMHDALAGTEFALLLHRIGADSAASDVRSLIEAHRPFGTLLMPSIALDSLEFGDDNIVEIATSEVRTAERRAMEHVVTLLAGSGHSRIGFIGGPEHSKSARARELGYLDALADLGLDRGASLITSSEGDFASGLEAARLLFEISPRPTAIVACNDEAATGVLHAACHAGIAVPEGLSVVGFDDSPIARRLSPALSTVAVPYEHLAGIAATRAANLQTGSTGTGLAPLRFIPRGTSASPG